MDASQRIRIEGHVSAGFDVVRDAFAENFSRRHELGGACCVYHRGEKLDGLHADHTEAETKHQRVDDLGRAWLADERFSPDNARIFISPLKELRATYEKHIAVEDTNCFRWRRRFSIGQSWKLSPMRWPRAAASWLVRARHSDEELQRFACAAPAAR